MDIPSVIGKYILIIQGPLKFDSVPVLHSGQTPPRVLLPVLEPSAQERHRSFRLGPEEAHKNDQRTGTLLLREKAGKVGAVQPGEEKTPGTPYCGLSVLKGRP